MRQCPKGGRREGLWEFPHKAIGQDDVPETGARAFIREITGHDAEFRPAGKHDNSITRYRVSINLFVAELAMGLMSRAAPSLNVFSLAFPVRVGVTLLVVALALPLLAPAVSNLLHDASRALVGATGLVATGYWLAQLGIISAGVGRSEEARARYEEALRIEPNDFPSLNNQIGRAHV